jgi:hypothetical protein
VPPCKPQRDFSGRTARGIGEKNPVIQATRLKDASDECLKKMLLCDARSIGRLQNSLIAEIADDGSPYLRIVMAIAKRPASAVKVDVAVSFLIKQFGAMRFIENDGGRPHVILRNRFEMFENIHEQLDG